MKDLVSIIMPSYNTANFIFSAIESVRNQTYMNWELIIVDDCSSDNTDEIVKLFLKDERIIYLKNKNNLGAAISRNKALRIAKGRWIAFLDSDDLWNPNKLKKQIEFMITNKYVFSYTEYYEIDENGDPLGVVVSGPRKISKIGMYNYCWPGCLTVMYNREILGDIQIINIKKNNDYAIWIKVCQKANCYLIPEVLASYRKRKGSISNKKHYELIKWHYKLFRYADKKSIIVSYILTINNLFWGLIKKIMYKRKVK